jgi:hypothetical protein
VKRSRSFLACLLVTVAACSDQPDAHPLAPDALLDLSPAATAAVTNQLDNGPGSFRQAVLDANADPSITRIDVALRLNNVELASTVEYTGAQQLTITGNKFVLDGAGLAAGSDVLRATGGGDLTISNITLRRGPENGLTVAVPATASGTQKVTLRNVTVLNNKGHGVLVNDQAEYFNDPNSTSPDGSAASLEVVVIGSRIEGNGFSVIDRDGLRLNEGGLGDLKVKVAETTVNGNGGDGIEFDERLSGDVSFSVVASSMNFNGALDPADFDDGIDIDEAGDGSIIGTFTKTAANDNFEQGYDINENDAGDIRIDMTSVEALRNAEEGIEYEEDDDVAGGGDIVATLRGITANGNNTAGGDAGLKIREKGPGNLQATVSNVVASGNLAEGIFIREDLDGNQVARIVNATTENNGSHGIDFDENADGDLDATVETSASSNNAGAGVRADQQTTGVGTLLLRTFIAIGNAGGVFTANADVTVTQLP